MVRSRLDFDTRFARDCEREPSYRRSSSPSYALNGNGTVKTEMQRRAALALRYGGPCSVCSEHECKCEMGAA